MTTGRTSESSFLFERPRSGERALLVHVDFPGDEVHEDLHEFEELVASAGARAVELVTGSRHKPDPRYFVGEGKAAETRDRARETGAELVIFNHALSPAQERNLERLLQCRVLDRIGLILDIFAQRADTFEGKLQVELAQLRHLSTRLVRGWSHLERQKGGIGLRGPGEKQLETDRRLISERIRNINKRLERVRKRRELSRRARQKADVPVVSLVGYTNAGKSTLFNRLTGARMMVEDRLFATLDPTLRRARLWDSCNVVFADTVGFIRHLPHDLVAAFRATLEETRRASLLLHVIDGSVEEREAKAVQVQRVLDEIGAGGVSQLQVVNKIDRMDAGTPRLERDARGCIRRVWLSARTGAGLDLLSDAIIERLGLGTVRRWIYLPQTEGRLRARLFELGTVVDEYPWGDGRWVMEVEIASPALDKLCRQEGLSPKCIAAQAEPTYHEKFGRAMPG
ncbi:MAG: GTPase HflX [Gammaproteobacteria bacterium]|nr:GTPase HflX [Gammaproteobacteria bacterium]NIR84290.1 GTPase HflX [Gammaproteobacteria bacterium]NIR89760.1 GTPase HflX [Gammaproteobacteria bacterium]NIU05448.1 GTPase HflX [Gammaproteobacteria bacterium]NIV52395.1 GTPase HflX [Gammaproteobacteria bacterium]